jgi:hypothetical protein
VFHTLHNHRKQTEQHHKSSLILCCEGRSGASISTHILLNHKEPTMQHRNTRASRTTIQNVGRRRKGAHALKGLLLLVLFLLLCGFVLNSRATHTTLALIVPPETRIRGAATIKPPVPASTSAIPHKIWFTYSHNLLKTNEPPHLAANVRHTIDAYRQAWDEPSAEITVYNDTMCRALLQKVEPLLVVYFDEEQLGMYRGDVCRTAILYMFGGYYFDLDLEVITPVLLKDSVTFATVTVADENSVFQAFLAGAPKHPIFRKALNFMLEYYQGKRTIRENDFMGPMTMRAALDSFVQGATAVEQGEIFLLEEVKGGNILYPKLDGWTKRENSEGCCCNFVVHDGTTPFFYSRIMGVNLCYRIVHKLPDSSSKTRKLESEERSGDTSHRSEDRSTGILRERVRL